MELVVKFNVDVTQSGLFEEAVGAVGKGFTTTFVVDAVLLQPLTVAVTL